MNYKGYSVIKDKNATVLKDDIFACEWCLENESSIEDIIKYHPYINKDIYIDKSIDFLKRNEHDPRLLILRKKVLDFNKIP